MLCYVMLCYVVLYCTTIDYTIMSYFVAFNPSLDTSYFSNFYFFTNSSFYFLLFCFLFFLFLFFIFLFLFFCFLFYFYFQFSQPSTLDFIIPLIIRIFFHLHFNHFHHYDLSFLQNLSWLLIVVILDIETYHH